MAKLQPGSTKAKRRAFARPDKKRPLRDKVIALYGRSCWLCGKAIAYESKVTLDHVRPLSKGGSSKIHNLRPAHDKCNRRRGNGDVPVLELTPDMIAQRAAA